MNNATIPDSLHAPGVESLPVSKIRKEIYLGDGLRRALARRPRSENLTTAVNLIAERYAALLDPHYTKPRSPECISMLRTLLGERDALTITEIYGLPSLAKRRLPELFPDKAQRTLVAGMIEALERMSLIELVALVEYLEGT